MVNAGSVIISDFFSETFCKAMICLAHTKIDRKKRKEKRIHILRQVSIPTSDDWANLSGLLDSQCRIKESLSQLHRVKESSIGRKCTKQRRRHTPVQSPHTCSARKVWKKNTWHKRRNSHPHEYQRKLKTAKTCSPPLSHRPKVSPKGKTESNQ